MIANILCWSSSAALQKILISFSFLKNFMAVENLSAQFLHLLFMRQIIYPIFVLLIIAILSAPIICFNNCETGQFLINGSCINCQTLPNTLTNPSSVLLTKSNCLCRQGFYWNGILGECSLLYSDYQSRNSNFDNKNIISQISDLQSQKIRLLATTTCDSSNGFVLYMNPIIQNIPTACINCRILPFGSATIISTNTCSCKRNFAFDPTTGQCICPNSHYINAISNMCTACSHLGLQFLNSCTSCSDKLTKMSAFGCMMCTTLENNGGSNTCCKSGYIFSFTLGICVCDVGFALQLVGGCTACGGNTDCNTGKKQYFSDGFSIKNSAFISNYDASISACKPGYIWKKSQITGQILGCFCSSSAKYYQGANICNSCSSPPSGVSQANCESCSLSAGFYLGSYECFYCPSQPNSKGTSSKEGCVCNIGYYWNIDTGKCQCDFALGFVSGTSGKCVRCSSLSNTIEQISNDACTCEQGYKWNSKTKNCDCDTSSPSIFLYNGNCINCKYMVGSDGSIVNNNACSCVFGYAWNPGKILCQCDWKSNFVVGEDSFCKDCALHPFSIGLAFEGGCACKNGMKWSISKRKCICASGSTMIGVKCTKCSDAVFSNSATVQQCTKCNTTKGFTLYEERCYYCPSQFMATSQVVNSACACPNDMLWFPYAGGCGCDLNSKKILSYDINSATYSCTMCALLNSFTGECQCPYQYQLYDSNNNFCIDCRGLTFSSLVNSQCVCNNGYDWDFESLPIRCVERVPKGTGYYSPSTNKYTQCSSLSTSVSECQNCYLNTGYVWLYNSRQCIKCADVIGTAGQSAIAYLYGCQCINQYEFDPISLTCLKPLCDPGVIYNFDSSACDVCDPTYSIALNSQCFYCPSDKNSIGYASSQTSCACKSNLKWDGSACLTTSCDMTINILINSVCFKCPTTDKGTGVSNGTHCGCTNKYIWITSQTTGNCQCPTSNWFIKDNSDCFQCISSDINAGTPLTNGKGCNCNKGYWWNTANNACECSSAVSGFILSDSTCFRCLQSIDSKFDGTVTQNKCGCSSGYIFIAKIGGKGEGSCQCPTDSNILSNSQCYTCSTINPSDKNIGNSDGKGGCFCLNGYIWDAFLFKCTCTTAQSAYILTDLKCLQCITGPSNPRFNGLNSFGNGCLCTSSFVFVKNTNNGGACECSSPLDYLTALNLCIDCPASPDGTGVPNSQGTACECLNGNKWALDKGCYCDTCICKATEVALTNGNCITCGATNTFTTTRVDNITCRCSKTTYFWNTNEGVCDCGDNSAMWLKTSTSQVCISCAQKQNVIGKLNPYQCQCSFDVLTWNPAYSRCDCGTKSYYKNGICTACTSDIYTNELASLTSSSQCQCILKTMTWSSQDEMCKCTKLSQVVFFVANKYTCTACSSKINALTTDRVNQHQCGCPPGLEWADNIGCVCNQPNSFLIKNPISCITCDQTIFATAVGSDKQSCTCMGSLKWKVNKCGCPKSSQAQILLNGVYKCFQCKNALARTATPVVSSGTACTCINANLQWYDTGICDCPNDAQEVWLGKPDFKCIACDSTIQSSGKVGGTCACLGNGLLTFSKGVCDCGANSALQIINDQYKCVSCSNAATFVKGRFDSYSCKCISTKLTWDSDTFTCDCTDNNMIIIGKGTSASCKSCSGPYVDITRATSTTCDCIVDFLIFKSTNAGVMSCSCPVANSILLYSFSSCLACTSKKVVAAYQCSCNTGQFWNAKLNQCVACTSIPGALAGNKMTCKCSDKAKVWDIATKTCISPCTTADPSCLDCESIAFASGEAGQIKTDFDASTVRLFTGGSAVKTLLAVKWSNYAVISAYQCPCQANYLWDSNRMQCLSSSLI